MSTGQHIFLIEQQKYAYVKSSVDENVFALDVEDGLEEVLQIDSETQDTLWTNKVKLRARVVLSEQSIQTILFEFDTNSKVLNLAE